MTSPAQALVAAKSEAAATVYRRLLAALGEVGTMTEQAKGASVHLLAGSGAFAGVHPRKAGVLLNIHTGAAILSPRIRKTEQIAANQFHNELMLASPDDVDAELLGWLRAAYALTTRT